MKPRNLEYTSAEFSNPDASLQETKPSAWLRPSPVPPPRVDPGLTTLSAIERSAEVLRYTARCGEHWISPEGLLREWLRHILRLTTAVAIPAVFMAPLITLLLGRLLSWTATAVQIANNISEIPAKLSSGMFLLGVGYLIVRWLMPK